MSVANLTPEEREEALKKAKESRIKKKEYAEKNLRLDCDDEGRWQELSRKYNYRLPQRFDKAGAKFVNRFLKSFQLTKEWYVDHTGYRSGNDEARNNPCMTAREQVGLLLESYDEDKGDFSGKV